MLVDFHSLYERYASDVYRFTLFLSGDSALADDICQEAFVRAWVTPGEISRGTVKAYLFNYEPSRFTAGRIPGGL